MAVAALAVGAVLAGAGGALSAKGAAKAQNKAQAENDARWSADQQYNYDRWRESRGEGGYAFMPLYANTAGGEPIEPALWADALKVYDAAKANMSPGQAMEIFNTITGQWEPTQKAAEQVAANIFSGEMERKQLEDARPVMAARTEMAEARKSAGLEALQQQLNEIRAIQKKKGFEGDSFGSNLMKFNARRSILTDSALAKAGANLENAVDERGIKTGILNTQLGSLSLPGQMATSAATFKTLPEVLALQRQAGLINSLKAPFAIGTSEPFKRGAAPTVQPVENGKMIWGSALSGAGNTLAAGASLLGGGGGGTPSGGGGLPAGGYDGGAMYQSTGIPSFWRTQGVQ